MSCCTREITYNYSDSLSIRANAVVSNRQLHTQVTYLHRTLSIRATLCSMPRFKGPPQPVPVVMVEPAADVVRTCWTVAMEKGCTSLKVLTALPLFTNTKGCKSSSAEGRKNSRPFDPRTDDTKSLFRQAVKQRSFGPLDSSCTNLTNIPSFRFGSACDLTETDELQFEIGQDSEMPRKVQLDITRSRTGILGGGLTLLPPQWGMSIKNLSEVASGRFDVSAYYLTSTDELQIKIAQGAKNGAGRARSIYSTPGVGVTWLPSHHTNCPTHDLLQLVNSSINTTNSKTLEGVKVKSVYAVAGSGLVQSLSTSGEADHDCDMGSATWTSVKHFGLPWDLRRKETPKTRASNERCTMWADKGVRTHHNATGPILRGADEYRYPVTPLINIITSPHPLATLSYGRMRVHDVNTCPADIPTQVATPHAKIEGFTKSDNNNCYRTAGELDLRFTRSNDMVGRADMLELDSGGLAPSFKGPPGELSSTLPPAASLQSAAGKRRVEQQYLDTGLQVHLIPHCMPVLVDAGGLATEPVYVEMEVPHARRVAGEETDGTGAALGRDVHYGSKSLHLPADVILKLSGPAGQLLCASVFNAHVTQPGPNATCHVRIKTATHKYPENMITDCVARYGTINGQPFYAGTGVVERICVQHSGVKIVVGRCGDNRNNIPTAGVILGKIDKRLAFNMSGGTAYEALYVMPWNCDVKGDVVPLEVYQDVTIPAHRIHRIHRMTNAGNETGGQLVLVNLAHARRKLRKVLPHDYRGTLVGAEKLQRAKTEPAVLLVEHGIAEKEGPAADDVQAHKDADQEFATMVAKATSSSAPQPNPHQRTTVCAIGWPFSTDQETPYAGKVDCGCRTAVAEHLVPSIFTCGVFVDMRKPSVLNLGTFPAIIPNVSAGEVGTMPTHVACLLPFSGRRCVAKEQYQDNDAGLQLQLIPHCRLALLTTGGRATEPVYLKTEVFDGQRGAGTALSRAVTGCTSSGRSPAHFTAFRQSNHAGQSLCAWVNNGIKLDGDAADKDLWGGILKGHSRKSTSPDGSSIISNISLRGVIELQGDATCYVRRRPTCCSSTFRPTKTAMCQAHGHVIVDNAVGHGAVSRRAPECGIYAERLTGGGVVVNGSGDCYHETMTSGAMGLNLGRAGGNRLVGLTGRAACVYGPLEMESLWACMNAAGLSPLEAYEACEIPPGLNASRINASSAEVAGHALHDLKHERRKLRKVWPVEYRGGLMEAKKLQPAQAALAAVLADYAGADKEGAGTDDARVDKDADKACNTLMRKASASVPLQPVPPAVPRSSPSNPSNRVPSFRTSVKDTMTDIPPVRGVECYSATAQGWLPPSPMYTDASFASVLGAAPAATADDAATSATSAAQDLLADAIKGLKQRRSDQADRHSGGHAAAYYGSCNLAPPPRSAGTTAQYPITTACSRRVCASAPNDAASLPLPLRAAHQLTASVLRQAAPRACSAGSVDLDGLLVVLDERLEQQRGDAARDPAQGQLQDAYEQPSSSTGADGGERTQRGRVRDLARRFEAQGGQQAHPASSSSRSRKSAPSSGATLVQLEALYVELQGPADASEPVVLPPCADCSNPGRSAVTRCRNAALAFRSTAQQLDAARAQVPSSATSELVDELRGKACHLAVQFLEGTAEVVLELGQQRPARFELCQLAAVRNAIFFVKALVEPVVGVVDEETHVAVQALLNLVG